ncbi:hypothetical protein OA92_12940 [Marinomonas sp. SBI22]|uniref:endonuclease/exonuclease/phosphatase family protein n=1 Tax=unclassified Marinomonas TaxID=196814 RepID=UPI0007AFBB4F|nr:MULTISPECIES: endonuclease/exonuclease/phosphatase family protein [unclassified Marinomonas]KZM42118.1 hypothetical protein OA92_12940 [Marinomonas sp. SBI22]KZM47038.1 hypothetical protein OA91_00465 [Marinomonas sp. SBI8L]
MRMIRLKKYLLPASFIGFTCFYQSSAYALCGLTEYEFSATGTKSSKGYDYQESGAPSYESADSGSFDLVVYNIDGFPECIGGNSKSDLKELLKRLESENYNLVLMQEMFSESKHDLVKDEGRLSKQAYPYRSKHWRGGMTSYGDGLLRLSDFPFDMANRDNNDYSLDSNEFEEYTACHGSLFDNSPDCWTEKGFSVAVHEITPDFAVHVYNTHMNAGRDEDDYNARRKQFLQLADFINSYSANATVIMGGDFNNKWSDYPFADEQRQVWEMFLSTTGMRLACQDFIESTDDSIANCATSSSESTDQVAYLNRDFAYYQLELVEYEELDTFTELSDHEPIRAKFNWYKKD